MEQAVKKQLQVTACKIRMGIIEGVHAAKSGHPGGSLSIADVLTYLYFKEMNIDPANPKKADRDRMILSKGHTAPGLYSALANRGYFPVEDLLTLRKLDSYLEGHPDMKYIPGVDMSTGSLGQGISTACGMAISGKRTNKDYRVYAVMGDGELEEGQCWEAFMFASHYKLDNLCVFIDFNGLQIDGEITKVMSPLPIPEKMKAFGFNVIEIDGHNLDEIRAAVKNAKETKGMPTAVVCHTVKGKGVSFMENAAGWHGTAPNKEQYEQAIKEIEANG